MRLIGYHDPLLYFVKQVIVRPFQNKLKQSIMMDTLHINNLQVTTHIGVHDWEQHILQTLFIDLLIPFDCRDCEDKLENTLNYDAICKTVIEFVQNNRFKLIETVANGVADLVKKQFSIDTIHVSVNKPQAIKEAKEIRVSVNR